MQLKSDTLDYWETVWSANLRYIDYHWDKYPVPVRRKLYKFMEKQARALGVLADMQEVSTDVSRTSI